MPPIDRKMNGTYRSTFSVPALMLFSGFLMAWLISFLLQQEESIWWWLSITPMPLVMRVLFVKVQRYNLYPDYLEIDHLLHKQQVPVSEITSVEIVRNPKVQQLITGFPPFSLLVKYQKYEEALLHPLEPEELKQALENNVAWCAG